jgi:hypothetical protein
VNEITLGDRVMLLDRMVKDLDLQMKSHNHSMIEFSSSLNRFYQRMDLLESACVDANDCNLQHMTRTAHDLIYQLEAFITCINS